MFKEPTFIQEQNMIRTTAIILLMAATASVLLVNYVYGEPLEKDPVPTIANSTEDVDISISPDEALPINGTVTMSTDGITDYDINDLVPAGVSILIQNDSVTMTNHEITIPNGIPIEEDDEEE